MPQEHNIFDQLRIHASCKAGNALKDEGPLQDEGVFRNVNSETKEARTIKLCTVIAYYITSITKESKFLNSHCSIVCSYCSVACLIPKSELKSDHIFKFFQIKQIHVVDSPFNEDPKNIIFSSEVLISGEGRPEILTPLLTQKPKKLEQSNFAQL